MKEEERLRRGAELLEWIKSEGGDVDSVRIARGPGGVGVFCARDVPRGVPFFQCPVRCVMRASDVKGARRGDADDAAFVAALDALVVDDEPIDDRVRLQLHLLNERARGSRSRYAPYIRSLPGRELVGNLPVSWACEEDPDELLCGLFDTHMFRKAHEDKSWLNKLSGALLEDPRNFPADAFGPDLLLWAHAVYWSRAIRLKLPGGGFSSASNDGKTDCLVPLLDSCNHAWRSRHDTGRGAIGYSLVAGAASKEGDEVCINYGMKDNGELLSSHGFVCREHARFDFTYVRIGVVTTCSPRRASPPIAKQLERLARVRDVVGRPAGKTSRGVSTVSTVSTAPFHAEIHFVEDEKGGVVGAFAPSAVAVARALYAPTDAEHDAARAALAAGVVDDWTRGPVHASDPCTRRAMRFLRAAAHDEWCRLQRCRELSGFWKGRGSGGPESTAEAWESTPGSADGGARAAIDLYYSTQMRLLRDVMAEWSDDGADAEDGAGTTEADDGARKRRRRENERGGGVLE